MEQLNILKFGFELYAWNHYLDVECCVTLEDG
jgi:hypothetical protein